MITTLPVGNEGHPKEFVTVNWYVPALKPETVVLAPVPEMDPGFIVQVPEGSPLKTTLPVETAQVGCVIVPTIGVGGVGGCALITIFTEAKETHPDALVTVNV
jgi:hypothetical protein